MLQKLRAHADSGIFYLKFIGCMALGRISLLQDTDAYDTSRLCKLHGITQEVQKHLIQSEPVAHDMFIYHICRINIEIQLL